MVRGRGFPRAAIKYRVPPEREPNLRHKVEIYVPAETEAQAAVANSVFKKFCEFFGGATMSIAKGGWVDADGVLIEDTIAIIHSYVTAINASVHKLVRQQAHQVQVSLDQDAVTIVFDNTCTFIERED